MLQKAIVGSFIISVLTAAFLVSAQSSPQYRYCPSGIDVPFFCADGPDALDGKTTLHISLGSTKPSTCTASGSPEWSGSLLSLIKRTYSISGTDTDIDKNQTYRTLSFSNIPVVTKTLFTLDCRDKIGSFEVSNTSSTKDITSLPGLTQTLQDICASKTIPDIQCVKNADCASFPYATGICGRRQKAVQAGHDVIVRYCEKRRVEEVCKEQKQEEKVLKKEPEEKKDRLILPVSHQEKLLQVIKKTAMFVLEEKKIRNEQRTNGTYSRLDTKIASKAAQAGLGKMDRHVSGIDGLKNAVRKGIIFPLYRSSDDPDPNQKLDILFVGMKSEWDVGMRYASTGEGEFQRFAKYVAGRGFHMYSPFRENITRLSIWGALIDQDFTGDKRENVDGLTSEYGVDRIVLISKEDFRSYAHYDGTAYISTLYLLYKDKKEKDTLKWSDNDKNDLAATVMHEFGHSFGNLVDEYSEESKGNSWKKPNCIKKGEDTSATEWWLKNGGNQDWRYSQSGKIPVMAGNFSGCGYNDENTRPTDKSTMNSQWKFDYAFGWDVYPHYGWINTAHLQEELNKYHETFGNSGCGDVNEWACGGFQPGMNNGEFCYDFAALSREEQGNICRVCGGLDQLKCTGGKNGMKDGCTDPYEVQSDGICRVCGGSDEPSCKTKIDITLLNGCKALHDPMDGICRSCGNIHEKPCSWLKEKGSEKPMKNGCFIPYEKSGLRLSGDCNKVVPLEYWECKREKKSDCGKFLSDWNKCQEKNENILQESTCEPCPDGMKYQEKKGQCEQCGIAGYSVCPLGTEKTHDGCFEPYVRRSRTDWCGSCTTAGEAMVYDKGACVPCGENGKLACQSDAPDMVDGCKPPAIRKNKECISKPKGAGLIGEYFEGRDFEKLKVVKSDKTIDFNWEGKSPTEGVREQEFSARWSGEIMPKYSEEYTFTIQADDGIRFWIGEDKKPLIDKWLEQDTQWTGKIPLKAGQTYPIRLEYFQGKWGSQLKLYWESKSQTKEIVPTSALSSDESFLTQKPRIYYFRAVGEYQQKNQITIEPHETVTLEWKADADSCTIAESSGGKMSKNDSGTFTWGNDYHPKKNTSYTLTCKSGGKTATYSLTVDVTPQFPCDFSYFKKHGKMTCGHIVWKANPDDVVFREDPIQYLKKYDDLYKFYADFTGYEPPDKKLIISTHTDYAMSASWQYHRINLTPDFLRDHIAVIASYPEKPLSSSLMHEMGHIFTLMPETKNAYVWHTYHVEPYGDIVGVMAYLMDQKYNKKEKEKLYWDGWCGKKGLSSPCRDYFTSIEEYFSVNPTEEKYIKFLKDGGSFQSFYNTVVMGYTHEHASLFTHMILDIYRDFERQGQGKRFYEGYRKMMRFYAQKAYLFPDGWLREDLSYDMIVKKARVFVYLLSFFTGTDLSRTSVSQIFEKWKWPLTEQLKSAIPAAQTDKNVMETNLMNLTGKQIATLIGTGTGLRGIYYQGITFEEPLLRTQTDKKIDFTWDLNAPAQDVPANQFSVRWKGQIQPRFSGEYTFSTIADDGVRLLINKQLLIDDWTVHGPTEKSGKIALEAGKKYDVVLEYYDDQWGAEIHFYWSNENQGKEIVPMSQLYPPPRPSKKIRSFCPEGTIRQGNLCVLP